MAECRNSAEHLQVVDTPNDVDYQTPRDDVVWPHEPLSPKHPRNHNKARQVVVESEDTTTGAEDPAQDRLTSWKGDSTLDMVAMFGLAQWHAKNANLEKAELLFLKALKSYSLLLGPTHEAATKVAIDLANFYTEQGQLNDADMIVEDLCQRHIEKFGIKHRCTQEVIQQVVDLLNGCNRPNDALAFLSRSKKLAKANAEEASCRPNKRSKTRRQGNISPRHGTTPSAKVLDAAQKIATGTGPYQVEPRTQEDRIYIAAKDRAFETIREAIIDHCGHHGAMLEMQNLRADFESPDEFKLGETDCHNRGISHAIGRAESIICRLKGTLEELRSHGGASRRRNFCSES